MNHPNQNNGGGGDMMDMIKSQMMTMTMISSMHGGGGNSNHRGVGSNSGMFNMVCVFIITAIFDFISKSVIPVVKEYLQKYYKTKIVDGNMMKKLTINSDLKKVKSASVTIDIRVSDQDNIVGQSILDYITNCDKTNHISYKNRTYIINQLNDIELTPDIFAKMKDSKLVESGEQSAVNLEQILEIFTYTQTMTELRKFIDNVEREYSRKKKNKLGGKIYYFNQQTINAPSIIGNNGTSVKNYAMLPKCCFFDMKVFHTNRRFTNLFGPEIDIVRKRVEFFIKNEKWYSEKGVPYTLGLLLSGQAGAGKTSSIKCLAKETNRHIININLNNDITKIQLENLFFNEMIMVMNHSTGQNENYEIPLNKRIYVLEDIDCQCDLVFERSLIIPKNDIKINDSTKSSEKIDLSFLLNLLDGVLEIPGRIVIMTSNHITKLDHALIRPGRIDVIADFKKCTGNTIVQMIEFFYDIVMTDIEKESVINIKDFIVSPAEMGKIMFENFEDYLVTIEKLQHISNAVSTTIHHPTDFIDFDINNNSSDETKHDEFDNISNTVFISNIEQSMKPNPEIIINKDDVCKKECNANSEIECIELEYIEDNIESFSNDKYNNMIYHM